MLQPLERSPILLRRQATHCSETSTRLSTWERYRIDMGASRCAGVYVGPHEKRRPREANTSQFAQSDVVSGDSFHTPMSAVYYTSDDARSLAAADGQLDALESQITASGPTQRGGGNSQVAFSRGHTQRAFRHALLVECYTPNENVASLAEFLEGLRESLCASLRNLIAEHHGLKLWLAQGGSIAPSGLCFFIYNSCLQGAGIGLSLQYYTFLVLQNRAHLLR